MCVALPRSRLRFCPVGRVGGIATGLFGALSFSMVIVDFLEVSALGPRNLPKMRARCIVVCALPPPVKGAMKGQASPQGQ